MNYQQIVVQVREALAKTLNIALDDEIHVKAKLKEDLGLDSMSSLSFLLELEETIQGFSVDPDTLESSHLETVESIANYVIEQQEQVSA